MLRWEQFLSVIYGLQQAIHSLQTLILLKVAILHVTCYATSSAVEQHVT